MHGLVRVVSCQDVTNQVEFGLSEVRQQSVPNPEFLLWSYTVLLGQGILLRTLIFQDWEQFAGNQNQISLISTWIVTPRHNTTRTSPCILAVKLVNSTARHTRRDKLDSLNMTSATGVTRKLVSCVICI